MAIDLGQWRLFVAVAEHGSLMKAAEALYTDQPALSRSLRRIETLIGAPLFVRTNRGVTLTELGRTLLVPAQRLVAQGEALEREASAEARRGSGKLRIGALDFYPLTAALAEVSQHLMLRGRELGVELVALPWLAHARAVHERIIDVGFTLTVDGRVPDPTTMRSRPLWDEPEPFALVSEHHPLSSHERIHPRELADLPLHLPQRENNADIFELVLGMLAAAGVPAPVHAPPMGSLANAIQQVAAGNGWSIVTGIVARHAPAGTVARPLMTEPTHRVQFAIVWHASADPAAITCFGDRLQAALALRSNSLAPIDSRASR